MPETQDTPRYRFGFIMCTALGNKTRYDILKKYADRDPEVEFTWAPITYAYGPGEKDPVRRVPKPFYQRAVIFSQANPVLSKLGKLDAVMVSQLENSILLSLRRHMAKRPVLFTADDTAPAVNLDDYPVYPEYLAKPAWRRKLRLWINLWKARRIDAHIPFSFWAGNILTKYCGIDEERVTPVHVGMDLDHWPRLEKQARAPGAKAKILFVGGDFKRKGGDTLLDIYKQHFSDRAELHLVTGAEIETDDPNIHVYRGLTPGDPQLRKLFAEADLLTLPTTADFSSWVSLEAMASSTPVVATKVGAIADIVRDGETGFIAQANDREAFTEGMRRLIDNPALSAQMGARGREVVESEFNASINVPRILSIMKERVEDAR